MAAWPSQRDPAAHALLPKLNTTPVPWNCSPLRTFISAARPTTHRSWRTCTACLTPATSRSASRWRRRRATASSSRSRCGAAVFGARCSARLLALPANGIEFTLEVLFVWGWLAVLLHAARSCFLPRLLTASSLRPRCVNQGLALFGARCSPSSCLACHRHRVPLEEVLQAGLAAFI